MRKSFERLYSSLAACLLVRLWQRRQQNRRGYRLERLGESLLVYDGSPAGVDDYGGGLHHLELLRAEDATRRGE